MTLKITIQPPTPRARTVLMGNIKYGTVFTGAIEGAHRSSDHYWLMVDGGAVRVRPINGADVNLFPPMGDLASAILKDGQFRTVTYYVEYDAELIIRGPKEATA